MLSLSDVGFTHPDGGGVSGIDLRVPAGSFTAITGPSGCGKSTLIALAAGLLTPDAGRVDRNCTRLAVVFQDPALLPWKSALSNVAFALIGHGLTRAARRARARDMLETVGLAPEDARKVPRALSGGMRQRVALARALATDPDLLLCDEPFAALDGTARAALGALLRTRKGLTTVLVTHDPDEAAGLADRLVVMSMGRIDRIVPCPTAPP